LNVRKLELMNTLPGAALPAVTGDMENVRKAPLVADDLTFDRMGCSEVPDWLIVYVLVGENCPPTCWNDRVAPEPLDDNDTGIWE